MDIIDTINSFDSMCPATQKLIGRKIRSRAPLVMGLNEDGTRFLLSGDYTVRQLATLIPEHRFGDDITSVAATDVTALIIAKIWDGPIEFRQEAKELYYGLLIRFIGQTRRAITVSKFMVNKELPERNGFIDHPDAPLSDYQFVASKTSLNEECLALFMEQGTGKTAVALSRIMNEAAKSDKMIRVLIVGPRQVRTNWQREFMKFGTVQGKVTVVRGGKVKRMRLLVDGIRRDDSKFAAIIVSYDSVTIDKDWFKAIPWDIVVLDESHKIKSTNARRTKAAMELRENSKRRMILTGTPYANSPFDLFSQLEFLAEGMSGFSNYTAFRKFYGEYVRDYQGATFVEKLTGLKNMPILKERLARIAFAITKQEAGLNLPPKVYDYYEVGMSPKQHEIYQQVAREMAMKLEKVEGNIEVAINGILTQMLRLAQITSGFVTTKEVIDPDTGKTIAEGQLHWLSDTKLDGLMELIKAEDRDPLGKTIVWAHFVPDIKAISTRLTEEGVDHVSFFGGTSDADRAEAERRFNCDPSCKVLVANAATAGEGLNLLGYDPNNPIQDTYCDHMIFYSCDWSFLKRSQAEDRAHRRGTRVQLRITDLIVPNTMDQVIRDRVSQKKAIATSIQDLRDILEAACGIELE